jgi:hypothetical protein
VLVLDPSGTQTEKQRVGEMAPGAVFCLRTGAVLAIGKVARLTVLLLLLQLLQVDKLMVFIYVVEGVFN